MRVESEEIMRVNGHNDQCTCVECSAPNQVAIPGFAPSVGGVALQITDQKFDLTEHDDRGAPVWGVPDEVGVKLELPLNRHVMGSRIVGAVELDHVAPTGRIVAVVLDVDGAHWALWWDRTVNALIARPMRRQVV